MPKKRNAPIHDLDLRVGIAIRRLRQHAGMTQIELAQSVGASQSCISLVECGRRTSRISLRVYQQIALVLNLGRLSSLIEFAENLVPANEVVKKAESLLRDC